MRRLRSANGVVPRAFKDHRSADARRYRRYCEDIQKQWGPLPALALPTLRRAGLTYVALEQLDADLEHARKRNQRTLARQIRREQFRFAEALARRERRIEELANAGRNGHGNPLDAVRAAVAEATR